MRRGLHSVDREVDEAGGFSVSLMYGVVVSRDGSFWRLVGVRDKLKRLLDGGNLGGVEEELKGDGVRFFFDPEILPDEDVAHDTKGLRTAAQTFAPYTIARNTAKTSSFWQAVLSSSSVVCTLGVASGESDDASGVQGRGGARKLLRTYFACMNFSRMGWRSYGRGFFGPNEGTTASHIEFAAVFPGNKERIEHNRKDKVRKSGQDGAAKRHS